MFIQSTDSLFRKPKGTRLQTDIPLQMHIIDVGGGLSESAAGKQRITIADLRCLPLQALWQGLVTSGGELAGPHPILTGRATTPSPLPGELPAKTIRPWPAFA